MMKRPAVPLSFLILLAAAAAPARAVDGREILRKMDDLWRGESSAAIIEMNIRTAHWERTLRMRAYSKGNLDDGSGLFNPTVTYSLTEESDLVAGAIVPWGAEPAATELRSEYGSYFTALWVQWRWSF